MKIRKKAVKLQSAELSYFLCNTVLLGGLSAMAPMIYFTFETLTCVISAHGRLFESDQCNNTSVAAMFLSVYLGIMTTVSIMSKAVSREDKGKGLTYENLAILKLEMRQKIQGALGLVTALVSMYLFSVLGVQGDPNSTNFVIGAIGFMTLLVAVLIELVALAFGESKKREQPSSAPEEPRQSLRGRKFSPERRISTGKMSDDMTIAGLV